MARDCPDRYEPRHDHAGRELTYDRQRGANWRNEGPGAPAGPGAAGRIGSGDAVDREYEVCTQAVFAATKLTCYSNSCKNSLAALLLEKLPGVLKMALEADSINLLKTMLNPGNVDPRALLHHGKSVMTEEDTILGTLHQGEELLHGQGIGLVEAKAVAATHTMALVQTVMVLLPLVLPAMLLHGLSKLQLTRLVTPPLDMVVDIHLNKPWAPPLGLQLLLD
jgi:hypothetical protein